jgi:hypothetical protein
MSLAALRQRLALAAVVLALPVAMTLLALPAAPHVGHDCPFEKECVACRWNADTATELHLPAVAPGLALVVGRVADDPCPPVARGAWRVVASRGPPPLA